MNVASAESADNADDRSACLSQIKFPVISLYSVIAIVASHDLMRETGNGHEGLVLHCGSLHQRTGRSHKESHAAKHTEIHVLHWTFGNRNERADRPGLFSEDQLYHLQWDPKEMKNLAYRKAQVTRMDEMRNLMQQDLEIIGRPFGEFIPGGNAAKPVQIDKQIEIVKQLEIKGKTVTCQKR